MSLKNIVRLNLMENFMYGKKHQVKVITFINIIFFEFFIQNMSLFSASNGGVFRGRDGLFLKPVDY
jgi:hypothetical protein